VTGVDIFSYQPSTSTTISITPMLRYPLSISDINKQHYC